MPANAALRPALRSPFQPCLRGPLAPGATTPIQRAIAFLRSLGTSAHVWLPGANGTTVASLPSNNYLLSDGSTGYSTVDGVDGLTLDAMGVQSTLVPLIDTFTFNPAGTTPPTTNSADTFLGVSCVSVTMPINAGGYGVCRGDSDAGGAARHTITAGRFYRHTYSVALSRALTGAESVMIYTTGVGGSSVLVLTSANAANAWIDGASSIAATITGQDFPVVFANTAIAAPVTVYFRQYSVKEYTGTRLTQPTTANKPILRRGLMNYLPYSGSFITNWPGANMTKVAAPDPYGGMLATQVTTLGGPTNLYTSNVLLSANGVTMAAIVKGVAGSTHSNTFGVYNQTTGLDLRYVSVNCLTGAVTGGTGASTPLGDGWFLVVVNISTGINSGNLGYVYAGYAGSIQPVGQANIVYRAALFHGIYTAAQILAEGGIPNTTATAASNPSAGKYWWSFNGSNNSLLSGNLGITNACTIVIAGRVNSLAAINYLLGEDTNGVQLYINTNGSLSFGKVTIADILISSAGQIVAGVPFVLTVRLSGGTAVFRLNGVQIATGATAYTFSATTGARIGATFAGIIPLNGALGWVVPSAVGLSDADCLTVERLVGSQFPGMAVF